MDILVIDAPEYPETPFLIEADGIPIALCWRKDVADAIAAALEAAGVDFGKGLPAKNKPTLAFLATTLLTRPPPDDNDCDSCNANPGEPPHTCPYAEEINGSEEECNCCGTCQNSCAQDI